MTTRRDLLGRAAFALARLAAALVLLAAALVALGWGQAIDSQQIQVRYVTGTTDTARVSAERELGLADGVERQAETWSYRLERRGRADIERLVSHPLVEDTHHIDRTAFRVVLDDADLWPPARGLVEDGWSPWLSALLALAGGMVLWTLRAEAGGAATLALAAARGSTPGFRQGLLLTVVGLLTAVVLPLAVEERPDEASFVHLYEARSLLSGDIPYRDFFEWGAPLLALLSAGVQWLVGYRLIGELLLQWGFTVAGVVVAARLGIRQAGRAAPVAAVVPLLLLLVPRTGYHFSKLFCIPVALWLAARYLDRPTARRSAVMGAFTALAFLFRHDFVLWAGLSSALAFALVRLLDPASRSVRRLAVDGGAYGLLLVATLMPWAVLVSRGEGLASYVAACVERFGYSQTTRNPYGALLQVNPFADLRIARLPEPRSQVVVFGWDGVDGAQRASLQERYGLHPLDPESPGPRRYQIDNVNDPRLLGLREFVRGESGFDWALLESVDRGVPATSGILRWLSQMTVLVPIALVASGVAGLYRHRRASPAARAADAERLLAGLVLAAVCQTLLREWSYFLIVAPVTAALGSQFLWPGRGGTRRRLVVGGVSASLLVLTTYAASVWQPPVWKESVDDTVRQLGHAWRVWADPDYDGRNELHAYVRECTRPEDRILITGSTPYYVPYYTRRAMAGGHLDWSLGLRDGPDHEAASLALLQRQSVPLVVGREGHVLTEFDRYARIRAYLAANFAEVDGTGGSIMYDTRRDQVRTFGSDRRPCFR